MIPDGAAIFQNGVKVKDDWILLMNTDKVLQLKEIWKI